MFTKALKIHPDFILFSYLILLFLLVYLIVHLPKICECFCQSIPKIPGDKHKTTNVYFFILLCSSIYLTAKLLGLYSRNYRFLQITNLIIFKIFQNFININEESKKIPLTIFLALLWAISIFLQVSTFWSAVSTSGI